MLIRKRARTSPPMNIVFLRSCSPSRSFRFFADSSSATCRNCTSSAFLSAAISVRNTCVSLLLRILNTFVIPTVEQMSGMTKKNPQLRWESNALGVSFVSRTSISFSGQHRSATKFGLSAVRRVRLRATRTASSRMTNFTFCSGLYVAGFSMVMPSISRTMWRPGVAGTNFDEPSICACRVCIWFA